MRVNSVNPTYRTSPLQQEGIIARNTQDSKEQVRIAENSNQRLVLMNLAMNQNLDEDAVQALFSRNLDYLTKRLEALGYEKDLF